MKTNKLSKLLVSSLVVAGAFVLVLAVFFYRLNPSLVTSTRYITSLLLVLDAIFYFVIAWAIYKKIENFKYFAILVLTFNAVAALFDELGFYDILASAINICLLVLVFINNKREYAKNK